MKNYSKLLSAAILASAAMMTSALHGSISITSSNFAYSQDFNSLPTANTGTFTWVDNETLAGWYRRSNLSNDVQTPNSALEDRSAQGSNVGPFGFYNASTANNSDRAIGFRVNGQNDPNGLRKGSMGMVFTNNSGSTITGFNLGYTGEKWYQASNNTTLSVQYAIVDSFATDINGDIDRAQADTWTGITALNWTVAGVEGVNTWSNGTQAGNSNVFDPVTITGIELAPGQDLVIRWRIAQTNVNQSGLFIDDVNFSVIPEPSTYAVFTGLLMIGFVLSRRKRA